MPSRPPSPADRAMGSVPATEARRPEPGFGTSQISPVLRTLTSELPSGGTAVDHGTSSPPSSSTAGPDAASEVAAVVRLDDGVAGAVLVVVSGELVVGGVEEPVGNGAGDPEQPLSPMTVAEASPTTRARAGARRVGCIL